MLLHPVMRQMAGGRKSLSTQVTLVRPLCGVLGPDVVLQCGRGTEPLLATEAT